jgi:hypothetical protein
MRKRHASTAFHIDFTLIILVNSDPVLVCSQCNMRSPPSTNLKTWLATEEMQIHLCVDNRSDEMLADYNQQAHEEL